MNAYEAAIARGRARYGEKFIEPETSAWQRRHFAGARVEVCTTYSSGATHIRRGRIGITTGWRASLMLVHRRSDSGSSDLLTATDTLIRVVAP